MKKFIYTLFIIFSVVAVYAQPKITSFSPMSGAVGATVEINGTGFNTTLGNNVVYFGPVKATVTNATATKLTVTVPTGGGSGPIQVIDVANNQLNITTMPFSITFAESSTPVSNSFYYDAGTHEISVTPTSAPGTGYSAHYPQMASGDFDGDGKTDFVKINGTVSTDKGADVFLNQSSGIGNFGFGTAYNLPSTLDIGSVATGDFNMDGKMDIVIGANVSSNSMLVFKNSSSVGTLDFNTGSPVTVGSSGVRRLKIADVNVDGKPDLVYAYSYTSNIYYVLNTSPGDGSITFGSQQTLLSGLNGSRGFTVGDLDADHAVDVMGFNGNNGTRLSTNTNSGSSPPMNTPITHSSAAYYGSYALVCDFNQDGKNDILKTDFSGPRILQNNYTSGTLSNSDFAASWTADIGSGGWDGLYAHDMNGDGKIDIVKLDGAIRLSTNEMDPGDIIDAGSSFTELYINNGSGGGTTGILSDDFDNDGKADILWHKGATSSNTIRIFENQIGEIKYYSKSTGSLSNLSTWGVATDGTGTNPTDFMGNEEFVLANRSSYTLTADMTVNKLTLESNKTIDLSIYNLTANQISGAGAGAFIKTSSTGRLSMTIPNGATATFEVGNSAYNPVSITNNTGTGDDFEVKVIDEVYIDGTSSGATVTGPRVQRTWDIDKTNANGGSGVDFTFNWNGGEAVNLVTPALYHFGSDWEKVAGSPTTDGNSMTYTGYTGSFSPFTVGDATTPLPVELTSFNATLEDRNNVMLTWSTAIELNNSHFEVHRSQDGLEWRKIDIVDGAGTTSDIQVYKHLDEDPSVGINYYRLKQIDFDEKFEFSNIVSINVKLEDEKQIKIYPNPSSRFISIAGLSADDSTIEITNADGKVLNSYSGVITQIDITHLTPGVYFVKVYEGEQMSVIRLMKN
ncbi:MAG: FG-GAP-like repeat-containing protein [Saprospiraceae bacterium]